MVIDNERSLFAIDHEDGRRSILAAWGTVPDSTVFLYLTGEDAASVDAVADALLLAG